MSAAETTARKTVRENPTIMVNDQLLSEEWTDDLIELRVQRGVRTRGRAVLRFRAPAFEKAKEAQAQLGASLRIGASRARVLFEGTVMTREIEYDSVRGMVMVLTAQDSATRLLQKTVSATRLTAPLSDLISSLVRDCGLRVSLPSDGVPHEWLLTAGTPLAVIDEVAARLGWDWILSGTTLALWPAATGTAPGTRPAKVHLENDLQSFSVRHSKEAAHRVTVHGWDASTKTAFEASAMSAATRAESSFTSGGTDEQRARFTSEGVTTSQREAAVVAQAMAGSGGRVIARGRGEFLPDVVPGAMVELEAAGPASGKYYVREVEHSYDGRGSWTEFVAGDRDAPRLSEPLAGGRDALAATGLSRNQLTLAIVTEVSSQVGDNPPGAVKVSYPTLEGQVASGWASLLQVGAGPNRGLLVYPEVNDQVVVAFADGDMRRPLVLGGIYSAKDLPAGGDKAVSGDGAVQVRSLTSRLGHTLELRDGEAPAEQHVLLELAGKEHRLRVGKDRAEFSVPANVPLKLAAGDSSITLDGNGTITLQGTKIVLKGTSEVGVSAPTVAVTATGKAEVSSSGPLTLKGATASVEASGPTSIKGAMVNIN